MHQAGAHKLPEQDQPETQPEPRLRLVESERRTITITGHPGHSSARRRRSAAQEQIVARPDRVALWAFLLGLFLVLTAAATAGL